MNLILISIIVLSVLGLLSAVILAYAAKKFFVHQDERIALVQEVLPGANCGGCGFSGCENFAQACVRDFEGKACPVGGAAVMTQVAAILGKKASISAPKIAVVRCGGSCEFRPRTNRYVGAKSCAVAASLYGGETSCAFGCLGLGDCVAVCEFGAIKINPETLLAEVDENACTSCGACVKACPKNIIQLREKGEKSRRIYVNCVNKDKGALTRKACSVGCIGCTKCEKECEFGAITIENNLAYIDEKKCTLCRKCVKVCPTGAIVEEGFVS